GRLVAHLDLDEAVLDREGGLRRAAAHRARQDGEQEPGEPVCRVVPHEGRLTSAGYESFFLVLATLLRVSDSPLAFSVTSCLPSSLVTLMSWVRSSPSALWVIFSVLPSTLYVPSILRSSPSLVKLTVSLPSLVNRTLAPLGRPLPSSTSQVPTILSLTES